MVAPTSLPVMGPEPCFIVCCMKVEQEDCPKSSQSEYTLEFGLHFSLDTFKYIDENRSKEDTPSSFLDNSLINSFLKE